MSAAEAPPAPPADRVCRLCGFRRSRHDGGRPPLARHDATPSQPAPILTADSITRIGAEAAGAVVVNGSHGGVYAAYVAATLAVAAAIFNDAGVGRDGAGIGGLDYLDELDIPAVTVGHIPRASATART